MNIHIPVMLSQVLEIYREHLDPASDLVFIDATLGAGGHAAAALESFPRASLVGFDQDEMARGMARERLACFGERVRVVGDNFSGMRRLLDESAWRGANGILFDLGVSNMQLTTAERGFSYQDEGPLDMRMDRDSGAPSAADIIADSDIRELTRIFRDYGEERHAFLIAKGIVRAREKGRAPETTAELTALIREILPAPVQRKMGTHPARRVFQALRIAVNGEMEALDEGLGAALDVAAHEALIVVISYHSLEDRMVKRRFLGWTQEEKGKAVTRRPLLPDEEEIESNRSARSAKLRAFRVRRA